MQRINEAKDWITSKVNQGIALAKQHKGKTAAGLLVVSMFVTGTSLANHYYNTNTTTLYHVYIDGEEIGTVEDPDLIQRYIDRKLEEEKSEHPLATIQVQNQIQFKEETQYKGTASSEGMLDRLADHLVFQAKAHELIINGETIGYVQDLHELEVILSEIKAQYDPSPSPVNQEKSATVRTASVEDEGDTKIQFKEEVKWQETMTTADQLLSGEDLKMLLKEGTLEKVSHTVEEGDCITCIASQYNITSQDIYQSNPGINEDTMLSLGQELVVTALRPKLTVQSIKQETVEETIHYPIEVIPTDTMYRGENKVLEKGSEGQKNVTYEIITENGVQVAKNVMKEEIVKEPVKERVQRGTKIKPSRGDGRFSWPTNGGKITSAYGMRWGRLHAGIDIAGASNRTIMAADNGKVIDAGWNGDYGNCVIIDHGNGYKTLYGHLSSVSVSVGDTVLKGAQIGVMGSTGHSTGVHLHFEILKGNSKVNPISFLRG